MITEAGYDLSYGVDAVMQNITFVTFAYVLVAPFLTTRDISREKTVGDLPSAPFMSLMSNCWLWVVYGVLVWDYPIFGANLLGALAGCYFTWNYQRYGSIPAKNYQIAALLPGASVVCAFSLESATALNVIGILGDVACTVMMASPLVAMRQVIRLKDSSSMPFQTSLAFFLNGVTWSAFGIFIRGDLFVIIPNALGSAVAALQLLVIAMYPPNYKKMSTKSFESDNKADGAESIELLEVDVETAE